MSSLAKSGSIGDLEKANDGEDEELGVVDRFRSVWNQLRFGWTIASMPKFTPGVPIYLLGRRYLDLQNGHVNNISCGSLDGGFVGFMADFQSRLWFTYRDAFPPLSVPSSSAFSTDDINTTTAVRRKSASFPQQLPNAVLPPKLTVSLAIRTSDCGWGCMLRSAQMLLAQALMIHFLGRDWTSASSQKDLVAARLHRQIIRWFADSPQCPLSIHRLVEASGCPPGTMYGPAAICRALLIAMANATTSTSFPSRDAEDLSQVDIYLARDRVICKEEVMDLFQENPCRPPTTCGDGSYPLTEHTGRHRPPIDGIAGGVPPSNSCHLASATDVLSIDLSDPFVPLQILQQVSTEEDHDLSTNKTMKPRSGRGVLLLVPMRLGAGSRINGIYVPTVLRLLNDPASVGLVGGRPRHSVYFCGAQTERLVYLDPHYCQDSVDVGAPGTIFNVSSWHCDTPRVMSARKLDPCCAFGFYCGSRSELTSLLARLPVISEMRSPRRGNQHRHHLIEVVSASKAQQLFSNPHGALSTTATVNIDLKANYPPIGGDDDEDCVLTSY